MYPEARPQVGHLAVVGRGVTSMVTPSGLGNTRLTWSVLGTNDSKREDTSRHHGRESRSLPDPATSYKPDQHANCRRTEYWDLPQIACCLGLYFNGESWRCDGFTSMVLQLV